MSVPSIAQTNIMLVHKRNGSVEPIDCHKITERLNNLATATFRFPRSPWIDAGSTNDADFMVLAPLKHADCVSLATDVARRVFPGIATAKLDELTIDLAVDRAAEHPHYQLLGGRLAVSCLHKATDVDPLAVWRRLQAESFVHGRSAPPLSPAFLEDAEWLAKEHPELIYAYVDYDRDYLIEYFGLTTLRQAYLLRLRSATNKDGEVVERPQHLWLRVAISLHGRDAAKVRETYDLLSLKLGIHATPTLFNAGTRSKQLASCFAAGTQVCTTKGVKSIEDVCIGDMVVSHTGVAREVTQLHRNPLGERKLLQLRAWKTPTVTVTDNHRFMATTEDGEPEWTSAACLTGEHYIMVPEHATVRDEGDDNATIDLAPVLTEAHRKNHTLFAPKVTEDMLFPFSSIGLVPINRWMHVTPEVAQALGTWVGDGRVVASRVALPRDGRSTAELIEWGRTMSRATGSEACLSPSVLESKLLGACFAEMFGGEDATGGGGRRLHESMFAWSKPLVRAFVLGLMNTTLGNLFSDGAMVIETTNIALAKQLYHMCRQVGEAAAFRIEPFVRRNNSGGAPLACVQLPKGWIQPMELTHKCYPDDRLLQPHVRAHWNAHTVMRKDGRSWVRVRSINEQSSEEEEERPEFVYTLGVDTDHSYSVEGLVVENCFLLPVEDDSLVGIMDTLKSCAFISKGSGGIGLSVSNVRAKGSAIVSTGGTSNGLVGMLRMFEKTVKYVDQGGGKRPGSACVYLEPWHPDIVDFVQLRRVAGDDETRVRGLFYAVWMCDLFMRRLATQTEWSLFCPDECPGLNTTHGEEFDALYEQYERAGKARATISPTKIWEAMLVCQMETGMPFLLYKDAVNRASNQSNLGTILSSNLCCEVVQFTSPDEIAVCNLASIGLSSMVVVEPVPLGEDPLVDVTTGMRDRSGNFLDYAQLERVAYTMTVNLNRVLDVGCAPVEKAQHTNDMHRPLGLGVQGLADVFCLLGLDFDSAEARAVNSDIFETIYFGALRASADLAERDGAYASFEGSPASRGVLQFDMVTRPRLPNSPAGAPLERTGGWVPSDARHDWTSLKARIRATGLRNSLLVALMPTASTSQILGFNECFEPITSNLYTRRTQSGVFTVINKHLVADMEALGRWTPEIYKQLLLAKGSVQGIEGVPPALLKRYRTADEIPMGVLIKLAADRQNFVCQSQSMNLWMPSPNIDRLTKMHTYGWQQGLKTSQYYLHSESKLSAQQFVVTPTVVTSGITVDRVLRCIASAEEEGGDAVCEMCSA